ncbi:hypothetical protein B7L68_08325 [Thermoproteus sp. CP80]|nr:hypothetical protein B7L68_08325 [Thermoproteus sp. CP80]
MACASGLPQGHPAWEGGEACLHRRRDKPDQGARRRAAQRRRGGDGPREEAYIRPGGLGRGRGGGGPVACGEGSGRAEAVGRLPQMQ